jgi:hypothetical protein
LQVLLLTSAQGIQKLLGLSRCQTHGFKTLALSLKLQVGIGSTFATCPLAPACSGLGSGSFRAGIEAPLAAWLRAAG